MKFAEFYHESTGWNGRDYSGPVKLIPAHGSDSVLPIDGRFSNRHCVSEARAVARRRGFPAFMIMRGARFSDASPASPLYLTESPSC